MNNIILILSALVISMPAFSKTYRVYIANSYDTGFGWTQEIVDGIQNTLDGSGLDVKYKLGYMNAFTENTEQKMERQGNRILNEIEQFRPDIVFTTDDDALIYIGLKMKNNSKLKETPVFFTGINGDPNKLVKYDQIDSINRPGHNITGVYQVSYVKQTFNLFKKMKSKNGKQPQKFAIFSDTTTTGKSMAKIFEEMGSDELSLQRIDNGNKKVFFNHTFEEWKNNITSIKNKADAVFILSANSIETKDGKKVHQADLYKWINQKHKIPVMGSWAFQVSHGALFSASDDGNNQGSEAALKALDFINGKKVAEIPITTPKLGVPVLNTAAQKDLEYNIPLKQLKVMKKIGKLFTEYQK